MRYRVHTVIEVDARDATLAVVRAAGLLGRTWQRSPGVLDLEVDPFPDLLVDGPVVGCGHCGATHGLRWIGTMEDSCPVIPYDPERDPDDSITVLVVSGDGDSEGTGGPPTVYCRSCGGSSRVPGDLHVEWT